MNKTAGQLAYEGYCKSSRGKSLISGEPLPTWDQVKPEIREAWELAAQEVINGSKLQRYLDALQKIANYPVHSEPVGGAMAMQDIAFEGMRNE